MDNLSKPNANTNIVIDIMFVTVASLYINGIFEFNSIMSFCFSLSAFIFTLTEKEELQNLLYIF